MALTFGSVPPNMLHSTLTVPPSSFPSSLSPPPDTPTLSYSVFENPWDPNGGGMNVQGTDSGSNFVPLGPVFGSSAAVLLAVVLTVRWKRHQTWRGVLGLRDERGLGLGSPSVSGDVDASRPCLWDAYVSPREKAADLEVESRRYWSDIKPLSASYTPPMPPPYPDPSDPLTACSTRTAQAGTGTTTPKVVPTTQTNTDCTCQERQMTPPNLPAARLRVSVLISMPTPPRSPVPPPHRAYNDHDHLFQQHDNIDDNNEKDDGDDRSDDYHSSTSSLSEIEEEKLKARAAMAAADRRERTADLSLVLGTAEVDVYDIVDSYRL